jgi:hypothetical protein
VFPLEIGVSDEVGLALPKYEEVFAFLTGGGKPVTSIGSSSSDTSIAWTSTFDLLFAGDVGGGDLRLKKLEIDGLDISYVDVNDSLCSAFLLNGRHSITIYGDAI